MTTTRFQAATTLGPVWLWGRDTGRPVLLVISGAFAAESFFDRIQARFPEADVLRTHLPGNHCPELRETSIRAYAAALDEALGRLWPGRPLMVFGVSVGGLVGLALRSPDVRSRVVIEPPLLTAGVWVFELFRTQAPDWGRAFVWSVFGVGPDGTEPRDHTWVLDGLATPTLALVGDVALGAPRNFERMPSLITSATRARLEDHPYVRVVTLAGAGHNVPQEAALPMHGLVVQMWNNAFPAHRITP